MNLIHKLFNPAEMYAGVFGSSIFEPRPSDAPRSSLEGFLAEVAERVQKTPVNAGDTPERKPASMDMVESSSSTPLMRPLGASESQSATRDTKISYVTQHALPRIGTWKSTSKCSLSTSDDSSSHG